MSTHLAGKMSTAEAIKAVRTYPQEVLSLIASFAGQHPIFARVCGGFDDLLQECYCKLLQSVEQYNGSIPLSSFLVHCARQHLLNHYKTNAQKTYNFKEFFKSNSHRIQKGYTVPDPLPVELFQKSDIVTKVAELYYLKEYSVRQIVELLDNKISANQVYSYLNTFLSQNKEQLDEYQNQFV